MIVCKERAKVSSLLTRCTNCSCAFVSVRLATELRACVRRERREGERWEEREREERERERGGGGGGGKKGRRKRLLFKVKEYDQRES